MTGEGESQDEVSRARQTLEKIEGTLAGVSAALNRLDEGSYGACEACGKPIGEERLAADPLALRCDCCQPTSA